jgi:hypothetical protein
MENEVGRCADQRESTIERQPVVLLRYTEPRCYVVFVVQSCLAGTDQW